MVLGAKVVVKGAGVGLGVGLGVGAGGTGVGIFARSARANTVAASARVNCTRVVTAAAIAASILAYVAGDCACISSWAVGAPSARPWSLRNVRCARVIISARRRLFPSFVGMVPAVSLGVGAFVACMGVGVGTN